MLSLLLVTLLAAPAPPASYLLRMCDALDHTAKDIPAMAAPADEVAKRVVAGGKLWAAGQPSVVSELAGRAAGLMLCKPLGGAAPEKGDVVLYALESGGTLPENLSASGAYVIILGSTVAPANGVALPNHASDSGVSPTLANAVAGWTFSGELIAAFTRLGKMPVIYETIGLYNGVPRINAFDAKGIYFHETHAVKPTPPGVIGGQFIQTISAILKRVKAEDRDAINRAATWSAGAKTHGKRLMMYSMGHLFPDEVAKSPIGALFESSVWNSGFTNAPPPNDQYAEGDVLIHIGYQHPPTPMLARAKKAGAKVAYVDVLQDRDYVHDSNVIWIDPMWNWADGCVPLENYEVPLLPASGVVNGAIAWEIYEATQREIAKANAPH
jgi:hypothetical protein